MRRLLAVTALLALVVAGPACGGGGSRNAVAVLSDASTKTVEGKSSRVAMTIQTAVGEQQATIKADGVFDYGNRHGTMSMDMSALGVPGLSGTIEMILLGNEIFMKLPSGLLPGTKPWLKIDLETIGNTQGFDLAGLQELGSNDPSSGLHFLQGVADGAKKVGEEEVRGVDTTHYQATIDLEKAKAEGPEDLRDDIDRMIEQLGKSTFPAEVWVDGDDFVRRFKFDLDSVKADGGQSADVSVTQELFDFGVKVEATAPPEDQVSDFSQLLQQAGQG